MNIDAKQRHAWVEAIVSSQDVESKKRHLEHYIEIQGICS
jgi:hypothetical protein